jgi:hypothetical protein
VLTALLTLPADERGGQTVASDIRDNPTMSRFEMSQGDGGVRRAPRRLIEAGWEARPHNAFLAMIPRGYRMHVQRSFLISSAVSDPQGR